MHTWTRRPQECEGTHRFSGAFFVTQAVMTALGLEEIAAIYLDIRNLVQETGGIDYFQAYVNEDGATLYFIDNCDDKLTEAELNNEERNYCTLLFAHEY